MGPQALSSPATPQVTSKLPFGALALVVLVAMAPSSAAALASDADPVVTGTFTLQHRAASEAVELIHPLLTERGAVELRPADNSLMIRDVPDAVKQALALLKEFDVPSPVLRFEFRIVSASLGGGGEPGQETEALPPVLIERLRELLRFDRFELLSGTDLAASEKQPMEAWVGPEFLVRFRVGVVQIDRRVKLHDFQVARRQQTGEPEVMIHTNLSLWLDKPMILGLARTESSERALMVVIHCTLDGSRQATPSTARDPGT